MAGYRIAHRTNTGGYHPISHCIWIGRLRTLLELVSHTVQPDSFDSMDLSAQAEELRQSISAIHGGTCSISRPYPVHLSTRFAASADNSNFGY